MKQVCADLQIRITAERIRGEREDKALIRFHRDMIGFIGKILHFAPVLSKFLRGDRNILCYARFNRAQQFIIVVNNDGYTRSMEIGVCGAGVPSSCQMTQIMYSSEDNYSMAPVTYQVRKKLSETDRFQNILLLCCDISQKRTKTTHINTNLI